MSLKASLDAMTNDANAWQTASGVLGGAKQSAQSLVLADSVFCFAGGEVANMYEQVRKQVEDLLEGGRKEMSNAAETLIEVRDDFADTDLSERDRHAGAWNLPG